jgi:uncharacterized protein YndB with AHSA1/START domain
MEEKIVRKEILVPATRQEIWDSWTTSEGIMSFFAPKAKIELAVGGAYECYFRLDNPPGLQGSEGCKVLAFWPMDYITFSWNAPPEFPEARDQQTKVVIEIDRADEKHYRVILTHMDFGTGGQWDEVVQFFDAAWTQVLDALRGKFEVRG